MLETSEKLADVGIEQLIAIDFVHTGRVRRRFFEKRLTAVRHHPQDFALVTVRRGSAVAGFAIARLLSGEFGRQECIAVLDVIGVEPESREEGVGKQLMQLLNDDLRRRGVSSLQSQVKWTNRQMLRLMRASGFTLAPRLVLERLTAPGLDEAIDDIPEQNGRSVEINYGKPAAPDFGPLARDRVPIRSMKEEDITALATLDQRITGYERFDYFRRLLGEALHDSDVRVSLVAERDGGPVGFIMARVNFGEFDRIESTAVIDTIGVDPDYRNDGIGRALLSQLLVNLTTLRVEQVQTEIDWRDRDLLGYLDHCGFRPSQQLCFEHAIGPAA